MLEGLDDIPWDQLTHAYGQAAGIPARIRALQSSDPADWVMAMSDLYDALCHQLCSIYPATAPAIPFLIELLGDRGIRCRGRILEFLGDVAFITTFGPDEDDEGLDAEYSQEELCLQVRAALWKGLDTYLELLSDLNERVRVAVPYLLGPMARADFPADVVPATIAARMQAQFDEEPNELVSASLVFGLGCLIDHDSGIKLWLEERLTEPHSSAPVRMAAALALAEAETSVSSSVVQLFEQGLERPDETNRIFESDHPEMEDRHHPIGRQVLKFQGQLTEGNDQGKDEDMKFPWCDRWQSRWVSFRILELLSKLKVGNRDRLVPTLLPYLDQADEYTGDSIVTPILQFVFGDRTLSPETSAEDLSWAERTVLLRLFNNLKLWATNVEQSMFSETGLGNRRADWARVLRSDAEFSEEQIVEILRQMEAEECSEPEEIEEIRLCRIGSTAFLPYLRAYTNLRILDFADTSLSDGDLERIAEFDRLRMLRLNNTLVTDAGIKHLAALLSLEELYLPGTKVTDRCLEVFKGLPKLKYVSLSNTAVTQDAAQKFMARHSSCRISQ